MQTSTTTRALCMTYNPKQKPPAADSLQERSFYTAM